MKHTHPAAAAARQPGGGRKACRLLLAIPLAVLLSGCSLVPWGAQAEKAAVTVIDAAEKDRKAYNDQKADVLLTLPCDISIGAYYRIDNPVRQKAVQELCSGRELGQPTPELGSGPAAPAPAQLPTQLPTQATP